MFAPQLASSQVTHLPKHRFRNCCIAFSEKQCLPCTNILIHLCDWNGLLKRLQVLSTFPGQSEQIRTYFVQFATLEAILICVKVFPPQGGKLNRNPNAGSLNEFVFPCNIKCMDETIPVLSCITPVCQGLISPKFNKFIFS